MVSIQSDPTVLRVTFGFFQSCPNFIFVTPNYLNCDVGIYKNDILFSEYGKIFYFFMVLSAKIQSQTSIVLSTWPDLIFHSTIVRKRACYVYFWYNTAKSNVESRSRQRRLFHHIHKATVPFVAPYFPYLSEMGKSVLSLSPPSTFRFSVPFTLAEFS